MQIRFKELPVTPSPRSRGKGEARTLDGWAEEEGEEEEEVEEEEEEEQSFDSFEKM